jgi:3-phenylpropionate/trans-cinnamate dioxygenase ferredoxin subunit
MSDVRITVRDSGPYHVEGAFTLVDAEGNAFDLSARGARIALCRCGGSSTKPFCDSSHRRNGFESVERAPHGAGEATGQS